MRARKIDVIMVYKIDRLTRLLADFGHSDRAPNCDLASYFSALAKRRPVNSPGPGKLALWWARVQASLQGGRFRPGI